MEVLKFYKQSDDIYMVIEDASEEIIKTISNAGRDILLYKDGTRHIVVLKNCNKSLDSLIFFSLNHMTKKGKGKIEEKEIPNVESLTSQKEIAPDISKMQCLKAPKNVKEILSTPYNKLSNDDFVEIINYKKAQHITKSILQQTGCKNAEEFIKTSKPATLQKAFNTYKKYLG